MTTKQQGTLRPDVTERDHMLAVPGREDQGPVAFQVGRSKENQAGARMASCHVS